MVDTTRPIGSMAPPQPESAEAGAPEIEVTPEMIESGLRVLWESGAIETPMEDFDRSLVQKIFVAMVRVQVFRS